jgi:ribosomal protein S18 acetylase RimI-like enzyme
MKIRQITEYDERIFKDVLKLFTQLSPGSELPDGDHFRTVLKSGGSCFFVAELDNNEIIGMLTICKCEMLSGSTALIEDVVVDENHRGRGYGMELMEFAVRFARSAGVSAIELTSRPSRIAANQLYRKSGFEIRETNVYRYTFK